MLKDYYINMGERRILMYTQSIMYTSVLFFFERSFVLNGQIYLFNKISILQGEDVFFFHLGDYKFYKLLHRGHKEHIKKKMELMFFFNAKYMCQGYIFLFKHILKGTLNVYY